MAQSRNERRKQKKRKARREKKVRMQREARGGEVVVVPGDGRVSMSEALIDFMEIDDRDWPDEEELRKTLTIGMVAWNAAIATGAARKDLIEGTLAALPREMRVEGRHWLDVLIKRKEAFFADNKRLMLDYELTMTPSGPHIMVMSTLDMP